MQGDVFLDLYSYYLWIHLAETKHHIDYYNICAYADDFAVVVDNIDVLHDAAKGWHASINRNSMKRTILIGKAEFMLMSRWTQEHDVFMGADKVYQMEWYIYPGVEIDAVNSQVTEVDGKIGKCMENFLTMYPLLKEKTIP